VRTLRSNRTALTNDLCREPAKKGRLGELRTCFEADPRVVRRAVGSDHAKNSHAPIMRVQMSAPINVALTTPRAVSWTSPGLGRQTCSRADVDVVNMTNPTDWLRCGLPYCRRLPANRMSRPVTTCQQSGFLVVAHPFGDSRMQRVSVLDAYRNGAIGQERTSNRTAQSSQ
jgi:hypothetical protein